MSYQKALVFLCILGFFTVNVTSLNDRPVTLDDLDSIKHLYGLSYAESFNWLQTVESVVKHSPEHVPAYYLVLNVWRMLVGDDLFLARLLSVYFSLVTLAVTYRLALLTRNRHVAVAAPVIMALLAYFQYYSQIARVYSLLPLVSGWVLWAYWQILSSPAVSRKKWLSLFASVASILYVHYIGAALLAAVALYHLFFAPRDRRWWNVVLVVVAACLPFMLWLPIAVRGFTRSQPSLTDSALGFADALTALLQIFSNGLWFLPPATAVILWLKRKKLNSGERYLAVVALTVFLLILSANEVTPILIARRLRYTIVLALPLSCAFAIAIFQLPGRRLLYITLLAVWIASSVLFAGSQEIEVYTNRHSLDSDLVPHYQEFIYEADRFPAHNEPILSFLPRATWATSWSLPYYRYQLSDWKHVINMSRDDQGRLKIESSLTTYASANAITLNSQGIWLIHNPALVSESALEEDFAWFTQVFRFCKRYLEKPESIIDYYLKSSIPCELVTDEQPLAIRYDNGIELGNLIYDRTSDSLTVFLRWLRTIDKDYSFTLQVFDERANKLAQFDKVISGDPIDIATFDLAAFPAGDYVVKLIVYDRESIASQSGLLLSDQQPFERAVDVLQFSV